jgi:hypothetical protein
VYATGADCSHADVSQPPSTVACVSPGARHQHEEIDRAATVSVYSHAPLICQFVQEDQAVRHSYHHLARIRQALQR